MTKLELISELLVEELHTFREEVNRLEQLDKSLQSSKIKVDSTAIEELIVEHLRLLEIDQKNQKEQREEILKILKHSRSIKKTCLL